MQAFDLGVQEVHFQSWGDNVQKLSSVAFDLAGINPKQVVVKLPCTLEGIQTAALLRDANIRCVIEAIKRPNHGVCLGQNHNSTHSSISGSFPCSIPSSLHIFLSLQGFDHWAQQQCSGCLSRGCGSGICDCLPRMEP